MYQIINLSISQVYTNNVINNYNDLYNLHLSRYPKSQQSYKKTWFIQIMDFSKFNHNIDLLSLLIFIWGENIYIVILKLYTQI